MGEGVVFPIYYNITWGVSSIYHNITWGGQPNLLQYYIGVSQDYYSINRGWVGLGWVGLGGIPILKLLVRGQ